MNEIFKFWSSKISKKTKLNANEKIGYLANQLIMELKASGRSIALPGIGKGFGSFDISIYNLGTEDESMSVKSLINNWQVEVKPTFKEF